jgi:Ser/Thr protein kinase RdoA (MazF antagonist)
MSSMAKVHGMDGALMEPDWPPLTLREVRALLKRFPGYGEPIEILSVSPRPFSSASVVSTRGERIFVKRHPKVVRDREGLLEEHRFLTHLWRRGAPVPRVFATFCGETAVETDEWTYEVHEAPTGIDLYRDALSWTPFRTAHHARSAGAALARLHLASQGFDAPQRKCRQLVAGFSIFADQAPRTAMECYLKARPALADSISIRNDCEQALELLAPFHAELRPLLTALEPLWTHNDLHASNLLWSDAGDHARVVTIFDFGLCDRTNAIHDLAQAIERNIVEWLALVDNPAAEEEVSVHLDHLLALLEGYEVVRPLSEQEAAALAPMTPLCHAEFALSEADYFLSVLHSAEKARAASPDYLVGHARWFRGAGGRKLLDALYEWSRTRSFQGVAQQ